MSAQTDSSRQDPVVKARKPSKKVFLDTTQLPWTPGPLEGTWFKLLNLDKQTGGSTMIFRVEPGERRAALHKHIGSVEGYMLEGEFGYVEDRGGKDAYFYESDAVIHEPTTASGFTAFLFTRGTLVGYAPDGSPAALIDGCVYYQLAKLNNAVDHLQEFDAHFGRPRPGYPIPRKIEELQQVYPGKVEGLSETRPERRAFVDTTSIPWSPWVMPGTAFKLLHVNRENGGWSMMLKVDAGLKADIHHHIGSIEGYIVSGGFDYGPDDIGGPDAYVFEEAEAIHEPHTENGFEMFAIFNGPFAGYNPDGSLSGLVDATTMIELARATNTLEHLEKYLHK